MHENNFSSTIYTPDTIQDALATYNEIPSAVLYAGGTFLNFSNLLQGPIISLQNIAELKRVVYTDSYIETGSVLPIYQLLLVGKRLLYPSLANCLMQVSPPHLYNIATLGGNICTPNSIMTALPYLIMLGSHIEIRRAHSIRWLSVSKLRNDDGSLTLEKGEIVTKIRIPLDRWTHLAYKPLHSPYVMGKSVFAFYGALKKSKGVVTDFRFALRNDTARVIQFPDIETELIGRRLPLSARDNAIITDLLHNEKKNTPLLEHTSAKKLI
jgi:CO/xanthine dehydrogenase FAD-binding subunit